MEIITVIIIIVVFLVTREFWTWFFKLNKITSQNTEIIRLLSKLADEPLPLSDSEKLGRNLGNLSKKK